MTTSVPNPGSESALRQGCSCPVLDNNHGRFPPHPADPENGVPEGWWVNPSCPIHSTPGMNAVE